MRRERKTIRLAEGEPQAIAPHVEPSRKSPEKKEKQSQVTAIWWFQSANDKLVIWVPVVWDSNRDTSKSQESLAFSGILAKNPTHQAEPPIYHPSLVKPQANWKILDWIYPPPRMPVANEGLGWDSLLKMVHNPGGDCYWVGGRPK